MDTDRVVTEIVMCLRSGHKVLTFGVGGNAANAIHFAAELAGKFEKYETPLPCIDLCSNVAVLTAITNDFGWDWVFARQIRALAKSGDIVVAFSISTGGQYLLKALDEAVSIPCGVVLICGKETKPVSTEVTVLELDSQDTPWVQEEQLRLIHLICRKVKSALSGS